MATHKSAVKEHRQSEIKRQRNRSKRSQLRTEIKKFRTTLAAGDSEKAQGMLAPTYSMIDRAAKNGAIDKNAATRAKSRLAKALKRVAAGA